MDHENLDGTLGIEVDNGLARFSPYVANEDGNVSVRLTDHSFETYNKETGERQPPEEPDYQIHFMVAGTEIDTDEWVSASIHMDPEQFFELVDGVRSEYTARKIEAALKDFETDE